MAVKLGYVGDSWVKLRDWGDLWRYSASWGVRGAFVNDVAAYT